jgi:lipoprotein signal peptidase
VKARLGIVAGAATLLTAADLVVKAALPSQLSHHRSSTWAVASLVLLVVSPLAARLPSRLLALAAGVFVAGLAGNLVSAGLHHGVVPNPFVAGNAAFNLADVLLLSGIVVGIVATMRLAARYRHLLPKHTIPVRVARYVAARRT